MNYIYDILLNYNTKYFDFFDWNLDDKLYHIRKIPIYNISTKKMNDIINNNVILSSTFIQQIKNKTEYFGKNNIEVLNYCALLSNKNKVLAIKADEMGRITHFSSMLLDEESDTLMRCKNIEKYNIVFKLVDKEKKIINKTRKKVKDEKYMNNRFSKCSTDKLSFLLYELTKEEEFDRQKIISKLNSSSYLYSEKIIAFLKL